MASFRAFIFRERFQVGGLISLILIVLLFTGYLTHQSGSDFQRFFGGPDPLATMAVAGAVGLLFLSLLQYKGWFFIYKKGSILQVLRLSGVVALFAAISILADLIAIFPEEMNIRFPRSLLFYPAIGFFAEIFFHVVPLSILFFFLKAVFKNSDQSRLVWISITVIALFEPTYQAFYMNTVPLWSVVAVWINLFLFNLFQLRTFNSRGFVAMYSIRLIYYLIWHIIWGHFRLELLF